MEEDEDIEILENLTKELNFNELIIQRKVDSFLFPGIIGSVTAYTIYRDDKISIARSFGKKGTLLPFHRHEGKEFFGPIMGEVKLTFEDKEEIILKEGDAYIINDKRAHNCEYLEDTWLWLVTYPPEFPITEVIL